MGYLAKFQKPLDVINKPGVDPATTRGELAFLINKFDPAKLFWIEQATEHSKSLLREWLPKYKFKGWTVKETSGAPVTDADRQQRADDIAKNKDLYGNISHYRGLLVDYMAGRGFRAALHSRRGIRRLA